MEKQPIFRMEETLLSLSLLPPGVCVPCSNTAVLQDGTDTSLRVRNRWEAPFLPPETGWDSPTTITFTRQFSGDTSFQGNAVTPFNPEQILGLVLAPAAIGSLYSSLVFKKARLNLTDLLTHN